MPSLLLELLFNKYAMWLLCILALIGGVWYFLNTWHYRVIDDLNKQVIAKDVTIQDLSIKLVELVEENKVTNFEEYFNGLSENNNSFTDGLIF